MSDTASAGSIRSRTTVLVLWCTLAIALFISPPANIISWDIFGYYLYLPATFIHHDPTIQDISWVEQARELYKSSSTLYQAQERPTGGWVLKYPMGLALLWSPFFLAGHLTALLTDAPADGFSSPYQWSLIIGTLCYVLLGLWMLMNVLRLFFSDGITALSIGLVVLGTNYLHQVLYSTGMPHIFLFALQASLLWYTVLWHREHRMRHAIVIGFLIGVLCLSRPSEIVIVLIPLFFGMVSFRRWRDQAGLWWNARGQVLVVATLVLAVAMLQFLYWKKLTGRYLYMSYNNPGEGFDFLRPYLLEVLFSFRKGWYIYTPLMFVATIGLFRLRRVLPEWSVALPTFFVMNLYVIASWSCWWYADSFGQRALVQSYAVMALPLGALLVRSSEQGKAVRIGSGILLVALVMLNLFQTRQVATGSIHTSRMTWPAYKAAFLDPHPDVDLGSLWSLDRSQDLFLAPPDLVGYRRIPFAELLGPGHVGIPWERCNAGDHAFVEVHGKRSMDAHVPEGMKVVLSMRHGGYPYGERKAVLPATEGSALWYLTPEVRTPSDSLFVSVSGVGPDHITELHLYVQANAYDRPR
ncbi:MAG: hypothetical protein IPN62_06285 [Flavobacteriales bacterium]|nr:hypothetical protein [Flavobacteriales bacterium]